MSVERTTCPHCERPMGVEYRDVEKDKCQLWRWFHEESQLRPAPRTVSDCFAVTSQRLRRLAAELEDARATLKTAQRALSRHHDAAIATVEPFRDDARIE